MTSFGAESQDAIRALEAECSLVGRTATRMTEEDFARPTRCPIWDVKVLLGHVWRDLDRIVAYAEGAEPTVATTDAVTYWRSYDPSVEGPSITASSRETAQRFGTGAELAGAFDEHADRCLGVARSLPPERLLRTRLTSIRLDEFVATRVVELVVHGLDLAAALGRQPWLTPGGEGITRRILIGLLGEKPPARLGWDRTTFIETGTGRRPLEPWEREELGPAADRFPLLG